MKSIIKLACGLVLSLAVFASCENKETYEPAPRPEGAQAYFSSEESNEVSLDLNQSKVTVNVYRANTDGALTVGVEVTDTTAAHIFRAADKVDFENGSNVATLEITFDFNKIVSDVEYGLDIKLANNTTPYASDKTTLLIKYAPWSPWAPYDEGDAVGIGNFTYSIALSGNDPGLDILYSRSLLDPTKYQFKIEGALIGIDFIFEYDAATGECFVPKTYIGDDYQPGDPIYCWEASDAYGDPTMPKSYFDSKAGIFYFYLVYFCNAGTFGRGYEKFALNGFYTPDYSLSMTYLGRLVEAGSGNNFAIVDLTIGEKGTSPDIDTVKYALVEGKLGQEEIIEYILGGGEGVVSTTKSGELRIPFPEQPEGSDFTIGAIAFDKDGQPQTLVVKNIEEYIGGNPWTSIGYCDYVDDIVATLFELQPCSYSVEVLVNENKPGVYRMVNPYGKAWPYGQVGMYDPDVTTYVDIDASDPEDVWFESELGINLGYGVMGAFSDVSGTLVDGVITFPVNGLACYDDDGVYYANMNGLFRLDVGHPYAEPKAPSLVNVQAPSVQQICEKRSPRAAQSVIVSKRFVGEIQ